MGDEKSVQDSSLTRNRLVFILLGALIIYLAFRFTNFTEFVLTTILTFAGVIYFGKYITFNKK
jgi:hypothetical protein